LKLLKNSLSLVEFFIKKMNLGLQIVGDFRELMIFLDLSFESLSEVLDA
jgi:hypothetical protein